MFRFINEFLSNCFQRIMSLILRGKVVKPIIHSGLKVNVKFGKSQIVPLIVQPQWTVKEVKENLSKILDVPANRLKIIFAGKQLRDSLQIQECDVGNHTILNAVYAKEDIRESPEILNTQEQNELDNDIEKCIHPLVESVLRLQLTDEERSDVKLRDAKRVHFFIYCNSGCGKISPGKLRVRCRNCKRGTLTVDKDPECWDDVLLPLKITGICQEENCDGRYAEFFFKCASNHDQFIEQTCVPLKHIKNNFKDVPCLACLDISQVILVFPCEQGHVICLECFQNLCVSRLQERNFSFSKEFGYTLSCPIGCENSFISEPHHFKLLSPDEYERYQRFGAEECLLSEGGVLCPQIGCGAGIIPDPDCTRITCTAKEQGGHGCGFVFCRNCLQGFHIGECVEENFGESSGAGKVGFYLDQSQGYMSRWEDTASKNTIKGTTKPCPKCRTPTERDGGCMHMVCSRAQCGYHWCWVCQTEWTRECMGAHWFG